MHMTNNSSSGFVTDFKAMKHNFSKDNNSLVTPIKPISTFRAVDPKTKQVAVDLTALGTSESMIISSENLGIKQVSRQTKTAQKICSTSRTTLNHENTDSDFFSQKVNVVKARRLKIEVERQNALKEKFERKMQKIEHMREVNSSLQEKRALSIEKKKYGTE